MTDFTELLKFAIDKSKLLITIALVGVAVLAVLYWSLVRVEVPYVYLGYLLVVVIKTPAKCTVMIMRVVS